MSDVLPERIQASCALCVYSVTQRMHPTDLQTILVCKRFPPVPLMTKAGASGMGIMAMHPPVDAKAFCFEFKHSPDKVLAVQTNG